MTREMYPSIREKEKKRMWEESSLVAPPSFDLQMIIEKLKPFHLPTGVCTCVDHTQTQTHTHTHTHKHLWKPPVSIIWNLGRAFLEKLCLGAETGDPKQDEQGSGGGVGKLTLRSKTWHPWAEWPQTGACPGPNWSHRTCYWDWTTGGWRDAALKKKNIYNIRCKDECGVKNFANECVKRGKNLLKWENCLAEEKVWVWGAKLVWNTSLQPHRFISRLLTAHPF